MRTEFSDNTHESQVTLKCVTHRLLITILQMASNRDSVNNLRTATVNASSSSLYLNSRKTISPSRSSAILTWHEERDS